MPRVLSKFCRQFFVHFYDFYPTHDDAAELGLGALLPKEKKALAPILDEIISSYNAEALVELWKSSPADVHFGDGEEIRQIFKLAREKIG
jgi:hypothetical protein